MRGRIRVQFVDGLCAGGGSDSSRSFWAYGRASAYADAPALSRPRRRAVGQRPAGGGFNRYFSRV